MRDRRWTEPQAYAGADPNALMLRVVGCLISVVGAGLILFVAAVRTLVQ